MRLHILEHVAFETPAFILDWARGKGLSASTTRLYEAPILPNPADFEALVIMGGPMGVYDEGDHPWLTTEKRFIEMAIVSEKKILGICLGAQLLAAVLGAKVRRNPEKEIGWFPVGMTAGGQSHPLFQDVPASFTAFHWHGDTFDIPKHGVRIAGSEACTNQAFAMNNHIIGLQFHLEFTKESLDKILAACGNEIVEAAWIQNEERIRKGMTQWIPETNRIMASILDRWIL